MHFVILSTSCSVEKTSIHACYTSSFFHIKRIEGWVAECGLWKEREREKCIPASYNKTPNNNLVCVCMCCFYSLFHHNVLLLRRIEWSAGWRCSTWESIHIPDASLRHKRFIRWCSMDRCVHVRYTEMDSFAGAWKMKSQEASHSSHCYPLFVSFLPVRTERFEMNNVYVIRVCVCVCDLILRLKFIMWFCTKTYWPDQRSFYYRCDDEISIFHYYYLVLVSSQPPDNFTPCFSHFTWSKFHLMRFGQRITYKSKDALKSE